FTGGVEQIDEYRTLGLIALTIGFSTGFFQWLVLKIYLPVSIWWVLATALGWSFAFLTGVYISEDLREALPRIGPTRIELGQVAVGIILGAIIGFSQYISF